MRVGIKGIVGPYDKALVPLTSFKLQWNFAHYQVNTYISKLVIKQFIKTKAHKLNKLKKQSSGNAHLVSQIHPIVNIKG